MTAFGVTEESADNWWVDWVRSRDISTVADRIQAIRAGTAPSQSGVDGIAPDPVGAMRLLGLFARYRAIEDLLELQPTMNRAGGFVPLDAAAVLTLAALTRPVEEAATLAIEHRRIEPGQAATSLADSIVHDVTAQRIVPEVAQFIAECQRQQQEVLAGQALTAFVGPSSGRSSFDKAQLYITLRALGYPDTASELLRLTLLQADAAVPAQQVAGTAGQAGIVAALHSLSPSESIAEDWIERQMEAVEQEPAIISLVGGLLIAERDGDTELARHVGMSWEPFRLITLCEQLSRRAQDRPGRLAVRGPTATDESLARRAAARLSLVRGYAAERSDKDLVEIIQLWQQSRCGELAATLGDLLADVAAGLPGGGARPVVFFDRLQERMKRRDLPAACRRELHVAAAVQVSGRETGAEVATLLGQVGRREQRRAAHEVNRQLVAPLLTGTEQAGYETAAEGFADYVTTLQALPRAAALTFWAVRALSDPAGTGYPPPGPVVADIAGRLYPRVRGDVGFDLLERYLEKEQWLSEQEAADLIARVGGGAMRDDRRWHRLLSTTVGRWADTSRRDDVVSALRRLQDSQGEADAIVHSASLRLRSPDRAAVGASTEARGRGQRRRQAGHVVCRQRHQSAEDQ